MSYQQILDINFSTLYFRFTYDLLPFNCIDEGIVLLYFVQVSQVYQ